MEKVQVFHDVKEVTSEVGLGAALVDKYVTTQRKMRVMAAQEIISPAAPMQKRSPDRRTAQGCQMATFESQRVQRWSFCTRDIYCFCLSLKGFSLFLREFFLVRHEVKGQGRRMCTACKEFVILNWTWSHRCRLWSPSEQKEERLQLLNFEESTD